MTLQLIENFSSILNAPASSTIFKGHQEQDLPSGNTPATIVIHYKNYYPQ